MKTRRPILTIICLITSMILISGLLSGCEGNTKGESALQRCGSTPKVGSSAEKDKEKKDQEKKETDTVALSDLHSFTAPTIDGQAFTEKDLAGHDLTMINVWATYCPPCLEEMPALGELCASLPDRVGFVTWCSDGDSETETAKKILKDAGFTNPTILLGDGDMAKIAKELEYVPTTMIVDAEGRQILDPIIGAPKDPKKGYTDYINKALKQLGKEPL